MEMKIELELEPELELGQFLGLVLLLRLGIELWKYCSCLNPVHVTELLIVMQMVDWLGTYNSLVQDMVLVLALALDTLSLMMFRSLGILLEREHLRGTRRASRMMGCLYRREQELQDKMDSYRHYLLVVILVLI